MNSSTSAIEHAVAPYLTVGIIITQPLSTLSLMFAIYGIYVVVFGLSIHFLSRRALPSKLYMGCTISLFVFATLYTATHVWGYTRQTMIYFNAATTKDYAPLFNYLLLDERANAWVAITFFAGWFMNAIADLTLIHRCCVIWQSKIMMYLLGFIAVILNGIALGCTIAGTIGLSIPKPDLYSKASVIDNGWAIATAFFQVLLALLTGGRIWWITREARRSMGQSTAIRYKSVVAIIIESGVLYAACLMGSFILQMAVDPGAHGLIPFDFGPVMALMSGLAPTMVIVRVAYGMSVDSVEQVVSTLQCAGAQGSSPNRRSMPTIDLQLCTHISGHIHPETDEPFELSEKMV